MLNAVELLQEIQREGDLEVTHLARRFAVSPGEVRRILASLREDAYLEEVGSPCPDPGRGCRFCPMRAHCAAGSELFNLKVYRLTEKGLRLIENTRRRGGSR